MPDLLADRQENNIAGSLWQSHMCRYGVCLESDYDRLNDPTHKPVTSHLPVPLLALLDDDVITVSGDKLAVLYDVKERL